MTTSETGPYFPGQQPGPCGHYHPDVVRIKDVWMDGDTLVRVCDCVHCGEVTFPIAKITCGHYQPGQTEGPVTDTSDLDEWRIAEKARLKSHGGD